MFWTKLGTAVDGAALHVTDSAVRPSTTRQESIPTGGCLSLAFGRLFLVRVQSVKRASLMDGALIWHFEDFFLAECTTPREHP